MAHGSGQLIESNLEVRARMGAAPAKKWASAIHSCPGAANIMDFENPLAQGVADHAGATPAAPALTWRGRSTSYAELAERMRSWAARLRRPWPGPVGLRAEKSPGGGGLVLGCMAAARPGPPPPPARPPRTGAGPFQATRWPHP